MANSDDSLAYKLYKDKIILYTDLGYNSAPFSLKDNFVGSYDRIKFKHNQKVVLGFGIAYKWFALRIGFGLPGALRSIGKYGEANYQDIGMKFSTKKNFWDIDFRNYKGYSVQDAYRWNDTLNSFHPNAVEPYVRSVNFSVNTWHFFSDNFRMQSVLGKVGDFNRSIGTWYVKSTLSIFGISKENGALTPIEILDSTQTKSFVSSVSALELGAVPGYAYVHRQGFWQASAFAGLGGVIQSKFFSAGSVSRGFLGLAPRIDLRFIIGYSKPKYFFWLNTEFDVKTISFQELKMQQVYHRIELVAGVRINKKQKEERKKD